MLVLDKPGFADVVVWGVVVGVVVVGVVVVGIVVVGVVVVGVVVVCVVVVGVVAGMVAACGPQVVGQCTTAAWLHTHTLVSNLRPIGQLCLPLFGCWTKVSQLSDETGV